MNDAGTTQANGGVTFATATEKLVQSGRVLNLGQSSSSLWSDGNIAIGHTGSTLRIESGSTLTATGNNTIRVNQIAVGNFINEGTFTKNGGTGATTIAGVNFTNSGTISVQTGTLVLDNNGTHSGAISLASGTTLSIISRTQSLNAGTTFSGAGTLELSAGTLQVNAPVSTPGTMAVNMSGGTINGSGALTINGLLTWSGGTMANAVTTQANGGVNFTTTANKVLDGARTLSLGQSSSSTWYDGNILANFAGATLRIESGSTLTAAGNNTFYASHLTAGTFINQGTFTKNGGTLTTTISGVSLNNTGTVKVESGTLLLNHTVTQHSGTTLTGGTWNVTNNSTLTFANGSNITTIGSAAIVKLSGAGSTFDKINTLTNNQGTFHLANDRDFTTAGNLANSGTLRVEDAATVLNINGTLTQTAGVTNLVNGGSITANAVNLNGGFLSGTGAVTLGLNGDLTAANGAKISPGNSAGTLTVNLSGAGSFDISGAVSAAASHALLFEIGAPNASDKIVVNGGPLKIGSGLLNFDDFDFSFIAGLPSGMQSEFTLFDTGSPIVGTLGGSLSGQINGTDAFISFGDGGNDIVLTVVPVPEPGTAFVGIALLGAAMGRRRRR